MKANEFKVGDLVVMVDASDYDTVFEVVGRTLRMYQLKGDDDLFYGRLPIQIRPATPEETKANRRLIPSNTMELEELDMVDVPPTAIVVDL
ncbi:hypothetical protein RFH42_16585 [Acinetobacter rudis]|uniref:hypothetical protein n=1 Tax=Acinetobacter rudis TaxID=632955 RepID=UPI00280DC949|nr:hypothetical protein [Acinetobacter rudis]MDQ8954568.1 hypothetical protein [Acinetobacter rudis]